MKRILVVDDEPSIRKALKLGLSSKEVDVDVAEDGSSGVRLGCQKQYDVLIVDLCLPDIDGLEVIRRVKQDSPEIISVVVTGNPGKKSSIEASHHGVTAYLKKPLDMRSIKDTVKRGFEERANKGKGLQK